MIKKLLKWIGIALLGLFGLFLLAGLVLYPIGMKKLTQTYPNIHVEAVNIPADADAIARGSHVALIWGCAECHGENMGGMTLTDDPFLGTISAPNLTSGEGGVGGSYSDADWVRAIRHGVKPNGGVEAFMYDYSSLSDQDLGDLIAYLKQIPPADSHLPAIHFGWITPLAPAIGWMPPSAELIDHDAPRPPDPQAGATIEYGRYLSVICAKCHGENLPSKLEGWRQEEFVRAFQSGVLPNGQPLPATMSRINLGELNETELNALWLYFMSEEQARANQ